MEMKKSCGQMFSKHFGLQNRVRWTSKHIEGDYSVVTARRTVSNWVDNGAR